MHLFPSNGLPFPLRNVFGIINDNINEYLERSCGNAHVHHDDFMQQKKDIILPIPFHLQWAN